jgi:Phage tail tube protein
MAQVTGRIFISLGGQRIRSKEGASLKVGGIKREPAISDAGVDGYHESVTAPEVDCSISHTADTNMKALQDFKGALTFETDTGRNYTLIDAWCAEPPDLTKGEVKLKFMARECIEG